MAAWSELELEHLFRTYLRMLEDEVASRPYVKAEYNRELQALTGRSRTSIEFKFANVSAVLDDLGLDWVQGYLPRYNYQAAMVPVARRIVAAEYPHIQELPRRTEGRRGVGDTPPAMQGAPEGSGDGRAEPVPAVVVDALSDGHVTRLSAPSTAGKEDALEAGAVLEFEALWERACGGASAAVSMGTRESPAWPQGKSAPGGDEVLEHVRAVHSARGRRPDEVDIVLLVGGPGNGKSELLRKAKDGLEEISESAAGVAMRRYTYRYEHGHELLVVNDASIPAEGKESPDGELLLDVADALDRRASALLAVNRGRLDDRTLHAAGRLSPAEERAREVLRWVHDGATNLGDDGFVSTVLAQSWPADGLLPQINCFVVLMDACSLLERRPKVDLAGSSGSGAGGYTIAPLGKRRDVQEETSGGEVLTEFVARVAPWALDLDEAHPIRANVESLMHPHVRAGVGTWLRAGELAAGRKATYRELWGAYVRAVVGELPEVELPSVAREVLLATQRTEYEVLKAQAYLRTHQTLVGVSRDGRRPGAPASHPVLRLAAPVDPVLDADPSWARPVHEAMAFRDPDVGPLRTLVSALEEAGAEVPVVSRFDELLDDAFVERVKDLDSSTRRGEEAWYGGYILRLYALSLGHCAFQRELDLWAREWRSTQGYWQEPVLQALRTLLFPAPAPGQSMLLPALQPRAVPILGASETPQLVRQVNPQHLLAKVRRGDQLAIRLDLGHTSTEIDLDFALLREAMACAGGGPGVTQHAVATLPRLERFRAALLRHESGQGYAVVDRENVTIVETNNA